MKLYFLRHAEAEEHGTKPDAARELTPKGHRQARRAAQWLVEHGEEPEIVVSSPLVRARQTAEPVAEACGAELVEDERLAGGGLGARQIRALVGELGYPESLLLVGHEPDFSAVIEDLIGGQVQMKKAALALLVAEEIAEGWMELAWLVPPRLQ